MERLILQSVDISQSDNGSPETTIVLKCGADTFTGRATKPENDDELAMVALATIEALRQYLPANVGLQLKKAAKMEHDSIIGNLLVVTIDCDNNGEYFGLTGSCLSKEEDSVRNIAKATLDATNRLVQFLSDQEQKQKAES